ncbi:MAG: T9SS type A sorting domain-containing protein [Bacteroidetes bacterium]|nr:T9SS type A sorting domain-containing protein [Bacteroidota bacterium]
MKTNILLTILTFPIFVFGQVTNHFDNLDTKWNVAMTYPNGNIQNPNFVATTTTVYGFQGDTLLNSNLWFKLYSTSDSLFQNNLTFKGFTRTDNNRVLFLDTLNQLDTLYDFNISIGDSILFNLYGQYPEKIPVINIDSIQINGQYYKRFHFAEPTMVNAFDLLSEVWIEGIGSIHGPIFTNFPIKFSTEIPDSLILTCTQSNSQQYWQHPTYNSCYLNIVLGIDNKSKIDLTFFPNPVQDIIKINLIKTENYEINVFNSAGQKLIQKIISSDFVTIDLTTLNDGIYFITVDSKNGRWANKLLTKHSL